jgi:hypothetical protein
LLSPPFLGYQTLLVPHLVIPYLERCVYHAAVLTRRAQANRAALAKIGAGSGGAGGGEERDEFSDFLEDMPEAQSIVNEVSDLSLDYPDLSRGIEATLRTLVICSFRAPRTRMMFQVGHIFFISEAVLPRKEAMHEIVHYASAVIIRSLTHSLAHIIYVYLPTYPPI